MYVPPSSLWIWPFSCLDSLGVCKNPQMLAFKIHPERLSWSAYTPRAYIPQPTRPSLYQVRWQEESLNVKIICSKITYQHDWFFLRTYTDIAEPEWMVLSNTHIVTHMSTGFVSFKLCQSSLEPWFDVPCRLQRPTRTVFKATIFVIYPYLWKHHPTNIWMKKDRSIDGRYDVAFCLYPQGRFEFFFLARFDSIFRLRLPPPPSLCWCITSHF